MSNNRLDLNLAELREALRNLPSELAGEASNVVEGAANGAAVAIRSTYGSHRRSGTLQDSVVVEHSNPGPFAAGAVVKATAKHAHLYEWGTQARHTAIGANRGSMPPAHAFVPAVVKARRGMYEKLKDLLERHGLVVSGDA